MAGARRSRKSGVLVDGKSLGRCGGMLASRWRERFYVFFQSYRGSGRAYSEKPAFSPIIVRYEWVLDRFSLPVMTLRFNLAYK
jgi:hypothetical protein